MKTHAPKCYKCDFESIDLRELETHEAEAHEFFKCKRENHDGKCEIIPCPAKQISSPKKSNQPLTTVQCDQCSSISTDRTFLETHVCAIRCDQCEFVANDASSLEEHNGLIHRQPLLCNFCEFKAQNRSQLAEHTLHYHEDKTVINTLADQIDFIKKGFETFESFKLEMNYAVNCLIQNQNTLKQELFVIRNNQINESKIVKLETMVETLSTAVHDAISKIPQSPTNPLPPPPAKTTSPVKTNSDGSPEASAPALKPKPFVPQPTESSSSSHKPEREPKILFIGDSISANIDIAAIENATRSTVVTAKAYSSVHDNVSNAAKQAARFPASNFTDVVPQQLKRGHFKYLVLQSGSVDITNLKTNGNPTEHIEYFKQETIQ